MSNGFSYESFAAKLGVTRDCLYKWEKSHPEFLYSKKVGKEKMLLLFEQIGLDAMMGNIEKFAASTYIFTMKNKCGWKDSVEQEITGGGIQITYKKAEKK